MYNNSFVRKLRSSPTVVTDIDDNSTCSCNTNTKLIFGDKCSSWLLALFLVANSNSSNYCSPSLSLSVTHSVCLSHFVTSLDSAGQCGSNIAAPSHMKYFYN